MRYVKLFESFSERDPKEVMSSDSWAKAKKLKAFKFKAGDREPEPDDPIYFVIEDDGDKVVAVMDEQMDNWLNDSISIEERREYYTEIFLKTEMIDYTITQ